MVDAGGVSGLAIELRADRRAAAPDHTARPVVGRRGVESHGECVGYLVGKLSDQHHAVFRDVMNRTFEVRDPFTRDPCFDVAAPARRPDQLGHGVIGLSKRSAFRHNSLGG